MTGKKEQKTVAPKPDAKFLVRQDRDAATRNASKPTESIIKLATPPKSR